MKIAKRQILEKIKNIHNNESGMEFIDIAVIVAGSIFLVGGIIALAQLVRSAIYSNNTDIPNYSKYHN